jgi:hypothetical protein
MNINRFYVYLFLREDGTPYYVGKGQGNRQWDKRRKTKPPADPARNVRILDRMSEEDAFAWEQTLIARYGRKDNGTGILRNLTDGGDGVSGLVRSEEDRRNKSEAAKRRYEDPTERAKTSDAQKGVHGYRQTDEWKTKISAACKGRKAWNKGIPMESEERRYQAGNGSRGRVQTPEEKQRRSEANKGKVRTPEQREKYRLAALKREAAKKAKLAAA